MLAKKNSTRRKIHSCDSTAEMVWYGNLGVATIDKNGVFTDVFDVTVDRGRCLKIKFTLSVGEEWEKTLQIALRKVLGDVKIKQHVEIVLDRI